MKLPKIPSPSAKWLKVIDVAISIFVISSFALNIHASIYEDDMADLRFLSVMGWGMSILWFVMYLFMRSSKEMFRKLLKDSIELHDRILKFIEDTVDKAEESAKKKKAGSVKSDTPDKPLKNKSKK